MLLCWLSIHRRRLVGEDDIAVFIGDFIDGGCRSGNSTECPQNGG
jgi:hypothetical protein